MEGWEELIKIGMAAGSPVIALGWWLRGQFNKVTEASNKQLIAHEAQDQRRHQQNIVRLARIETRLGINIPLDTNGSEDDSRS